MTVWREAYTVIYGICESCEQISRNLPGLQNHRLPIRVSTGPAGVVPRRHAHVRVAELGRDIAELYARSQ